MKRLVLILLFAAFLFGSYWLWQQVSDCQASGTTFDFHTRNCV